MTKSKTKKPLTVDPDVKVYSYVTTSGGYTPQPAINVAIPNTTEKKMEAISRLSEAMVELAKALNSTNVQCSIMNNSVTTVPNSVGINVTTK